MIQKVARGYLARKKYQATRQYIIQVQTCIRRRQARRQLIVLRAEARSVSHLKEASYKLESRVVDLIQNLTQQREEKSRLKLKAVELENHLQPLKCIGTRCWLFDPPLQLRGQRPVHGAPVIRRRGVAGEEHVRHVCLVPAGRVRERVGVRRRVRVGPDSRTGDPRDDAARCVAFDRARAVVSVGIDADRACQMPRSPGGDHRSSPRP